MRFILVLLLLSLAIAGCAGTPPPPTPTAPYSETIVGPRLHSFQAQYASKDGISIGLALSQPRLIADHDLKLRTAWPLDVIPIIPAGPDEGREAVAIRYWLDGDLDVVRIETGRCPTRPVSDSCNPDTQSFFAYWGAQGSLPPFGLDLPRRLGTSTAVAYSLNGRPFDSVVERAEVGGVLQLKIPEAAASAVMAFLSHGATYDYGNSSDWLPTRISNLHYYPAQKLPSAPLSTLFLVQYEGGPALAPIDAWPKQSVAVSGIYQPIYNGQNEPFFDPGYTTAEGLEFLVDSRDEVRQALENGGCVRLHGLSPGGSGSVMGIETNGRANLFYAVETPTGEILEWGVDRDVSLGTFERYSISSSSPEVYKTRADAGSCRDLSNLPGSVTTGAQFWEAVKQLPIQSQGYELTTFSFGSLRLGLLPASGLDIAQSYSGVYFPPGGGFARFATMYGATGRWSEMILGQNDLDAIDRGERLTP
ncbi:MAG: hypothetical protein AABX89_03400 [Candidatus Thermoplasmatota archaeon]